MAALAGCSFGVDDSDPIVEDLQPGDTTGYPGAIRFSDRYEMAVTRRADGTTTMSGLFYHTDRVLRLANGGDGTEVTYYLVDGDGYVVTGDACTAYPDLAAGLESVTSVDAPESPGSGSDSERAPELTVTDRTTTDGRAVLVLELPADELSDVEQSVTYYVDEETRYLRRIETETAIVEYHSWNDVEPIDPPDMACQSDG